MENRCPCTGQTVTLTSLQDLCIHCPVEADIAGGLPRIAVDIASHKKALTQDLFLDYCKEQLLHFAGLAGEYANRVANPHYNSESVHVSTHFWALAVSVLYRTELAHAQPLDTPNNEPAAAPASLPNSPLLTPATIRTLYLKLLAHPALASELTAYQKSELRAYAESEALGATREAVGLMDANPQYPYPLAYRNGREIEHWQERIASYPDSQYVLRLLTDAVPTNPPAPSAPRPVQAPADTPAPAVGAYPWAEIDALAERIVLRVRGRFVPADKWIPKAVAGMIDALREAGIIPETPTLPAQYDDFAAHYKCKVGGGRNTPTRLGWRVKALRELGLI